MVDLWSSLVADYGYIDIFLASIFTLLLWSIVTRFIPDNSLGWSWASIGIYLKGIIISNCMDKK
ncbi:hypothetical protein [Vibrio sp. 1180_3]|uniref:hypothetical protein n=1 Tax=Vibrio sp. 1180_3 TaxID=2528832 RepID=UPI0024058533|nr:hypothetical protein [Vibrio sp. 1180_3]MDF9399116.1 hypothetical protein [Vibrio sp. 1180_3]